MAVAVPMQAAEIHAALSLVDRAALVVDDRRVGRELALARVHLESAYLTTAGRAWREPMPNERRFRRSTPAIDRLLDAFDALHEEGNDAPSLRVLAARLGRSHQAVSQACGGAVRRGWLVKKSGRYRTYMLTELAGG